MADARLHREQVWRRKLRCALRGLKRGIRAESNFFVHLFAAAAVIAAGIVLDVSLVEWCLLATCIAGVLAAEMFNTAIEHLVRATSDQFDPRLADVLDISSAGVLLAAVGASLVGGAILLNRLGVMLAWWSA